MDVLLTMNRVWLDTENPAYKSIISENGPNKLLERDM